MSKAPKASDMRPSHWVRRAMELAKHAYSAANAHDLMLSDLLPTAERAEAEVAEGESVEGLMRECADLVGGERILIRYGDTFAAWVSRANLTAYHTGEHGTPGAALRALRSALKPATPDASWLDGASFEEMERWLPPNASIRATQFGYEVDAPSSPGACAPAPTRLEAVRAFLRAHPELWEGKR